MTFNEYRTETIRTMKHLGSPLLDSVHMTLGIVTEVIDELPQALNNMDYVNIGEEIGDVFWYLSNYANIWGIETNDTKIKVKSEDLDTSTSIEDHYKRITEALAALNMYVGKFADLDKKAFAYNKQVSIDDRTYLFFIILLAMEGLAIKLNLDSNQIRLKNINKLKVRYPEKFTDECANNRDLSAELETLK